VWAACLRASEGANGTGLALACEDGSVRLFDAEEDYQVHVGRILGILALL
jgi:hypothetical protein